MKVYLAVYSDMDDFDILGVFADLPSAVAAVGRCVLPAFATTELCEVREYEIGVDSIDDNAYIVVWGGPKHSL